MSNRLAHETSPYLRQHADNPVDWWPWSAEALAQARAEDKPVLLSVGYSACHWCHVMAHESFEDADIAAQMNRDFINIKVDREERPDLDKIYQLAHQIMTQRPGGWPLTIILDPATQAPFMAGTYFPRDSGLGMPAFGDVLRQVADWYAHNSHQMGDQKQRLDAIFARLTPAPGTIPDASALTAATRELIANFDAEHGGFTGAPKFPHPSSLALAQRLAARGEPEAGVMAHFSLARMSAGGLFDQLGGGFFRYSVDVRWEIPHFEKMLYDNGPLLSLYAGAAEDPAFPDTAYATADWVLREMRAPGGGFYSSLDADSDGGEGCFYVWDRPEAQSLLDADFALFADAYGLSKAANFEGVWHLRRARTGSELAADFGMEADTIEQRLAAARQRLFAAREHRTRPGLDDKILTAWNALMIEGLADAAGALGRPDYLTAAQQALDFLRAELWRDGRLFAVHAQGQSHTPGYLDDYAFVLEAVLALLQQHWRSADLAFAQALADALLAHFEDHEAGGFYFTADDQEPLLTRPKPLGDESTPAGNGIAARALLHLGWLVGEPRYLRAAERTLALAGEVLSRFPLAHASLVLALDDYLQPPPVVILRGSEPALADWARQARGAQPLALVFSIPTDTADLSPGLAEKRALDGPVAYICRAQSCSAPVTHADALVAALS